MRKMSAISPRTNAFMSESPNSTEENSVFERVFSDMAYGLLETKMPDLAAQVITFKILDADIAKGTGVGVFIVKKEAGEIYLPIILSGNSIKPPEMFYSKSLDTFLPLDKEWLLELDKVGAPEIGFPVDPPDTLSGDPGLDNIVTPPYAGRFSYASAPKTVSGPNLITFLGQVGDRTKEAFATFLAENPRSLRTAVKYHGQGIMDSLRHSREKTAAAAPREWHLLDNEASAERFTEAFGDGAAEAYKEAAHKGLVVRETRKHASIPVTTETTLKPQVPADSGVYKVVDNDGKVHTAAVFVNPASAANWVSQGSAEKFLVILPGGDYVLTDKLIALATEEDVEDAELKKVFAGEEGAALRSGKQILVRGGGSAMATLPMTVSGVADETDGTRRGTLKDVGFTIVVARKTPLTVPHRAKDSKVVFVPDTFHSVKVKDRKPSSLLVSDEGTLRGLIDSGLTKISSDTVRVRNMGAEDWSIDGAYIGHTTKALAKLAERGVRVDAAWDAMQRMSTNQPSRWTLVAPGNLHKLGSIFGPGAMAQAIPQDPSMMDPSMMGGGGAPMGPGGGEASQINPQFMDSAAQMNDQGAFDTAAVASLLESPELSEVVSGYLPELETALDNLGRILLSLGMREDELKAELGKDTFVGIENNVRRVFKGLGGVIMKLNQNMVSTQDPIDDMVASA